jgi:hypothetical protein
MKVSWDFYFQYMEKKCSKPPASKYAPVNTILQETNVQKQEENNQRIS